MVPIRRVLVTGGAGYVGAALVPRLLQEGYAVRVLDLYLFGDDVLDPVRDHPGLEQVKGDLRDPEVVRRCVTSCEAVIHLACISNDPSFELNPQLGRSINYDAFSPLVRLARQHGVRRFIYASSSSVYGISEAEHVNEEHRLVPITDYSKYKALCEPILLEQQTVSFIPVVIRPATLCGYSRRQRFDLTVNILTNHAVNNRCITVFGGSQKRPNLHIDDMVDLYAQLLELPDERVAGKVYNAGYQNKTVAELAGVVRDVVRREMPGCEDLKIVTTATDDLRSYHISSEKIRQELGFTPRRGVEEAVRDLVAAFRAGKLPESLTRARYFNIKTMQQAQLQ